jgi:hypothetical protein
MEPKNVLCLHGPVSGPHPKPEESIHNLPFRFFMIYFNIILHLHAGLQCGLFPSDIPTIILLALVFSLKRATCPVHHIRLDLVFLIPLGN